MAADWPMHPVRIPWPAGIYETARAQIAKVLIEGFPLLVANVYGYSRSHLQAAAATDALLEPITKELVFGRVGPRVICGDLNADEDVLLQTRIWRQQGWIEIQELTWQRWGRIPAPTCKDVTRRDFLDMSPEVAALCTDSAIRDIYQEHSTVSAKLVIASNAGAVRYWPRPAEIPWNCIALDGLNTSPHVALPPVLNPTRRYQKHAQLFEQSLNGHVASPGGQLPASCFGRARFKEPVVKNLQVQASRASRAGDEVLQSDFLSLEVRRWFKQLRRLQSLRQALQNPRYEPAALEYRGCLWQSIKRAPGFHQGFVSWWSRRPIRQVGCPLELPCPVPTSAAAEAIFFDFRENFRSLERWHIAQRHKVLAARHEASRQRLFQELREEASRPVDLLVNTQSYEILGADQAEGLLHIDRPPDTSGHSEWRLDGPGVQVELLSPEVCRVEGQLPLPADGELEQLQYVSAVPEIHAEFVKFWSQQWNKPSSDEQWSRILAFTRARLPASQAASPARHFVLSMAFRPPKVQAQGGQGP